MKYAFIIALFLWLLPTHYTTAQPTEISTRTHTCSQYLHHQRQRLCSIQKKLLYNLLDETNELDAENKQFISNVLLLITELITVLDELANYVAILQNLFSTQDTQIEVVNVPSCIHIIEKIQLLLIQLQQELTNTIPE